jgi:hypothetical protein
LAILFRPFDLLAPNTGNPEQSYYEQSKMDNPEKLTTYGTQDEDKQNKNTTDHYTEAMSVCLSHFCKNFNPALHISW